MMPFAGGIEAIANGTLILSVAAAILCGFVIDTRPTLLRSLLIAVPVAALAVLAVVERGPILLGAALILGAASDAMFSREGEAALLAGLGSAFAARLAYSALFVLAGSGIGMLAEPWRLVAAAGIVFLLTATASLVWGRMATSLRVPIFACALLSAATGVLALTVPSPFVVAGAVLFIASGGLLAAERFVAAASPPHCDWVRRSIWGLQYAAQLSITLGFLLG